MFTGIIEELGSVRGIRKGAASAAIEVGSSVVVRDVRLGDSIAVNGVCLTVVEFTGSHFSAEVMAETLRRTNLGELKPGDKVNLERALRLSDRLGGHIVSGHIDGVGVIKSVEPEGIARVFTVQAPDEVMRYVIAKGSIAIDGISLTVVDYKADNFRVSIIPHTMGQTTLGFKKAGDKVNLEPDVVAKYIERLLPGGERGTEGGNPRITAAWLAEKGFV